MTLSHGAGLVALARTSPARGTGRTLLVASDGLWRYARLAELVDACAVDDLDRAASRLVARVRLPSGALQDDVALALVRAG